MRAIWKSIALSGALLISSPQPAWADGQPVPGLAVANVDAVVGNSLAFKAAQSQRPLSYKGIFDAAEARRAQISAQLQPMVDKFNRDRQAPSANTPAGQSSLQLQAQTIQSIQQSGQQELQKMLEPVALSEAYVQEQIGDKLNAAIQSAMIKKNISLVINSQSVVAATNAYNLNQTILDELNMAIPSAQLAPPAGWKPREGSAQIAAAQQIPTPPSPPPSASANSAPAPSDSIDTAKKKCSELGFVTGTPKFGQCVLKVSE